MNFPYRLVGKATESQKAIMTRLGIGFEPDISKQAASDQIGKEIDRRKAANRHGRYAPGVGNGEVVYQHGVMVFCDDGNGNVWEAGDEDDYDYEQDGY